MIEGIAALAKMEQVETTTSGIFVMPKGRVEIFSTYLLAQEGAKCETQLEDLQQRFESQSLRLERLRSAKLP